MTRLWDKGEPLDEAILRLTVGRDPELDLCLVSWDCLASMAHATMLESIGILSATELAAIRRELAAIKREALDGAFVIQPAEEDGHTAIENRLTDRLGEPGRKIHTGRSRNDQVIAALRLWGRDAVLRQLDGVLDLAARLLDLAAEHRQTTMPGYTHTRQAMPTTLGHFFSAWAENLLDNVPWLQTAFAHLNRSPLGSASGFGVGLPLDRQLISDLLRFERLQLNTLAVQNDRGKSEHLVLSTAATVATDLGRLAADLILFSSSEYRFLTLPANVTTGSSIMPQKRNPDVLELIRAGAASLRSRQCEVAAIYGGLTAGYHRDLQLTKEPFIEGMRHLADMLLALRPVLDGLEVDRKRCRESIHAETEATDVVYADVRSGTPFRDAYRANAEARTEPLGDDAWRHRAHAGAPGATDLLDSRPLIAAAREWLVDRQDSIGLDLLETAPDQVEPG